jgi:signal transduction histidine kinase
MSEQLHFEADAAIITRLGQELVAKQETALIELVKNAFDADARKVEVVLSGAYPWAVLEIKDDGAGMTRSDIIDGFLTLASNLKYKEPVSPEFGRRRAGRKGIGRFATQRLGEKLILTTQVANARSAHRLTVDWTKFVAGKSLEKVPVTLETIPAQGRGTTLRIEKLRDEWSEAQVKRAWRGVIALQQPFPVAPVSHRPKVDPGFSVRVVRNDELYKDESAVIDIKSEILDHLHAVIQFRVDDEGAAQWRIQKNKFGDARPWKRIHHGQRDAVQAQKYDHLRNAWMTAHYVILDPQLLPSFVFTRVRDVLSENGGIRLYRNGFRVVPYGEPDNDWLRLDETYAKRGVLMPVANRNFFGVIEVEDSTGALFEEHTSREGLIETAAFRELRDLASSVLVNATTQIAEDRGRKTRAGTRPKEDPADGELDAITEVLQAARTAAQDAVKNKDFNAAKSAAVQTSRALQLLQVTKREIERSRARYADEAAMLRFLATIGMTTAEFSHETGMTFDAFRADFEAVFKVAMAASNKPAFVKQATRAQAMLQRLDALTSYLNALAATRAVRGMRPISLRKTVNEFKKGVSAQAASQNIELEVDVPDYDALFTAPMHQAEIASVLLNFYTNAVKAVRRSSSARKILVVADRIDVPERQVRIRFSDTGDGVSAENREKVFDAFFTTTTAPPSGAADSEHATGTGLGLSIVRQIAENAGGEVMLVKAPRGYSTTFEIRLPAEEEK